VRSGLSCQMVDSPRALKRLFFHVMNVRMSSSLSVTGVTTSVEMSG